MREITLGPLARHNVVFGENGSGKTSLLEAAHILGTARSFRAGAPKSLITHNEDAFVVQGNLAASGSLGRSIGVQRERNGAVQLRVAAQSVQSAARLADELPLLVLNADSFDLLLGEPANRRRFMDWGVFHVEHELRHHRSRFQRTLSQRNHLLRRDKLTDNELEVWTRDLAEHGEAVAAGRERFLSGLRLAFKPLMYDLAPELGDVDLAYRRGWDSSHSYAEALLAGSESDRQQGFTQRGPQRADIRFTVAGYSAAETLSRGQQKLVVCALKLAQGQILREKGGRDLLYLIDDLPSELDGLRCERVCRKLSEMRAQTLITSIEEAGLPSHWLDETGIDVAMFHVKHGEVQRHAISQ